MLDFSFVEKKTFVIRLLCYSKYVEWPIMDRLTEAK